jgi:enterochelin esterase-like enzyme
MGIVNIYYGYYQTWSQLSADLSGNYATFTVSAASRTADPAVHGRLDTVMLPGSRSGIDRKGAIYLPPQYFQPRFAHTVFPTVELIHGYPGSPSSWIVHLRVVQLVDQLISHRTMGPTILVMPAMSVGRHPEECLNAPGTPDDTYITDDVRADVLAHYRASPVPASWGIAGYSSGGYCTANLALRHPAEFGAAGIMDGYFRPQDGEAAGVLHFDPQAEAANDPLLLADKLRPDSRPLPAIWLAVGTGDRQDYAGALAFEHALHGVEHISMYREPHAGHNVYAWEPALPHLLAWMWQQLADPALRVQFPIAGAPTEGTITPLTAPVSHPARPVSSPGHANLSGRRNRRDRTGTGAATRDRGTPRRGDDAKRAERGDAARDGGTA